MMNEKEILATSNEQLVDNKLSANKLTEPIDDLAVMNDEQIKGGPTKRIWDYIRNNG